MVSYNKTTTIQDSFWVSRKSENNNHEDTLRLSQEMFSLVSPRLDEDGCVEVQLYKQDFIQSVFSIIKRLNELIIKNTENGIYEYDNNFYERFILPIEYFFGQQPKKKYKVKIRDTKKRLMALPLVQKFSPRLYFVDRHSKVEILLYESGTLGLKVSFIEDELHHTEGKEVHPLSLQQIFYGAPGTGKSFHVDDVCKKHEHFRTTFHPDSDYSTFVGCYKPSMTSKVKVYSQGELISKLTEIKKTGTTYPCQKFAAEYWESLTELSREETITILKACDFGDSMYVEIGKGIAIGQDMARRTEDSKIVYKFTPQAFTNAYIKAWELHESNTPVFLVVEEINRGNCAQIFGDLFQLLDRNDDGYSTYEITPDTDLQDYISQQGLTISGVTDSNGVDISAEIASGKLMKLPNNLHIWATMNTSDQSLFPIDSAFKRRWDWVYKPIKYSNESWKVVLEDGRWCKWTELQQTLNDLIYDATESEDKMLGDWFVRAENNVISEEVLVGKIIFYLWNDVAKVDAGKLFDLEVEKKFKKEVKENNKRKVIFSDFYNVDGTINSEVVKNWLKNIGIECSDAE